MADEIKPAEPTHEHETGALAGIESLMDVPKRLLEAILEGLAKEPSKWMVIGLGFYLGYKGIDVLKYFMTVFKGVTSKVGEVVEDLTKATLDLTLIPFLKWDPAEFLLGLFGSVTGSVGAADGGKKKDAQKPVTSDELAKDPEVSNTTVWRHELEARMIAGAAGALVAVVVTGPGFLPGVGSIISALTEAIPL